MIDTYSRHRPLALLAIVVLAQVLLLAFQIKRRPRRPPDPLLGRRAGHSARARRNVDAFENRRRVDAATWRLRNARGRK